MLGFNKYIPPFQHQHYRLEFNIAGLDTIKYDNGAFKRLAEAAIDQTIAETSTKSPGATDINPDVGAYLLLRGGIVSPVDSPGDRALFQLGAVRGLNLCVDFTGNRYRYFGNFPKLTPSAIAWRLGKLAEILQGRLSGVDYRVQQGIATTAQKGLLFEIRRTLEVWVLANTSDDRNTIQNMVTDYPITLVTFTLADVESEVSKSAMY